MAGAVIPCLSSGVGLYKVFVGLGQDRVCAVKGRGEELDVKKPKSVFLDFFDIRLVTITTLINFDLKNIVISNLRRTNSFIVIDF